MRFNLIYDVIGVDVFFRKKGVLTSSYYTTTMTTGTDIHCFLPGYGFIVLLAMWDNLHQ